MRKLGTISACVTALLAFAAPASAQSYDDAIEVYQATTVQMDVGKMQVVRIGITEWSTPEDRQEAWAAFKEGGSPGVAQFLSKQSEKGFVKFPDKAAYKMHYAYQFEKDGKRTIVMLTDRPSKAWDLAPVSETERANLTMLKLVVDADSGKGEGDMLAAAELRVTEDGKIGIDAIGTQPIRFTKVKQTKPGKKKKK
jgi:hypothetical protein